MGSVSREMEILKYQKKMLKYQNTNRNEECLIIMYTAHGWGKKISEVQDISTETSQTKKQRTKTKKKKKSKDCGTTTKGVTCM